MTKAEKQYGDWAIILGSAEGIGESYSRILAQMGYHLIMVDHHQESLISLAKELEKEHKIHTKTMCLDLAKPDVVAMIMNKIKSLDCRLFIYNAAYSLIKDFTDYSSEELDGFLNVNTKTPLHLVHSYAQFLKERGQGGGIILMSSLAGLIGMQLVTPYAASKAFTWNLAEALYHELKPYNIDVMACIAGATSSRTYINTQAKQGSIKPQIQTPEEVVFEALKNLGKKALHISGFSNRLNYFLLLRILPRKMSARIANKVIWKMYK